MDTWATSSLTPQIAGKWEEDRGLFAKVFPMDLRPQAHEIIRTWLFSTVVRSELEHARLPWRHAAISGWILDPDRKKIGKSVGNAITPLEYLERYSTDAVRYWAGSARLGADTVFSEEQMKVGRRLAIKILNASRFVLSRLDDTDVMQTPPAGLEPLDAAMLARLAGVVEEATAEFDGYDHARALEITESFFWSYCDDYLELVKARAYGDPSGAGPASATTCACGQLVGDAAALRPVPALLHRGSVVLVAVRLDPHRPVAVEHGAGGHSRSFGPARPSRGSRRSARRHPPGQDRGEGLDAHRGRPLRRDRAPDLLELVELASGDLTEAGAISQLDLVADPEATSLSVLVELAGLADTRGRELGPVPCDGNGDELRPSQSRCGNTWANTSRGGIRPSTTVATRARFLWRITTMAIRPGPPSGAQPLSTPEAVKWPVKATRQVATFAASCNASGTTTWWSSTMRARGRQITLTGEMAVTVYGGEGLRVDPEADAVVGTETVSRGCAAGERGGGGQSGEGREESLLILPRRRGRSGRPRQASGSARRHVRSVKPERSPPPPARYITRVMIDAPRTGPDPGPAPRSEPLPLPSTRPAYRRGGCAR